MSKRYIISEVLPDDVAPAIRLSKNISETTGTYDAWIIREGLMTKTFVQPYNTEEAFELQFTLGSNYITFKDGSFTNTLNIALIRPGTVLSIESVPYVVLKFEPVTRRALVTPPLLADASGGAYLDAEVYLRPDLANTPVSVGFLDRLPGDCLDLELQASTITYLANTTNGSKDVTLAIINPTTINAMPGDYFILLGGADSLVDVGSGPGVFPIHQIVGGTTIRLADQLSATGTFRYGLRRKVPNEG